MRKFVVKASKSTVRKKNITASSVDEMLEAFENRLAEFGVESSTRVTATDDSIYLDEEVDIYNEDY